MKRIVLSLFLLSGLVSFADTNGLEEVRRRLDDVMLYCASNRVDYWVVEEAMNFESFHTNQVYNTFAISVSNDWTNVLCRIDNVTTNSLERLLSLGVGKHFGEQFYIDYIDVLADMRTNNVISSGELSWARASARFDLMSCFIRRYQEPKVRNIIGKFLVAEPSHSNRWNQVLSGAAYTNYLEEVEAGLWQ